MDITKDITKIKEKYRNDSALQISWVWHFPSLKNSMTLCVTPSMTLYIMQSFVWQFTSLREYDTICMTQKVQPRISNNKSLMFNEHEALFMLLIAIGLDVCDVSFIPLIKYQIVYLTLHPQYSKTYWYFTHADSLTLVPFKKLWVRKHHWIVWQSGRKFVGH